MVVLLAQMGLWYQVRPLSPGETAVVTLKLNDNSTEAAINSISGAKVVAGPVHVFSQNEIVWNIRADQNGDHRIIFNINGREFEKNLVVGNGFMRVSPVRPGWHWADILLYPAEKPFPQGSPVESISIDYPRRISKTSGTDWWIGYFFIVSMISALILKPMIKVKI